jgi:hypothetical protein
MFTTVIHVVTRGSTLPVIDQLQRGCALYGVQILATEASGQTVDFFCNVEHPSDLRLLAQEAMFYPGVDQFSTGWKGAFAGYGSKQAEEP